MTDQPVILADSEPPRVAHIFGASHLPLHVLMAAASQLLAVPTVDQLIDEALDADPWPFAAARWSVFRDRGLVQVSTMEAVELGIPTRSLRGWSGSPEYREFHYVDRRCLKRYRRRAGIRQ